MDTCGHLWTLQLDNASKQGAVNFLVDLNTGKETLSSLSVSMCTKCQVLFNLGEAKYN